MSVSDSGRGQTVKGELERLVTDLRQQLGDRVRIAWLEPATSSLEASIAVLELTPSNPEALPVRIEVDHDFARFTAGHNGGIWELRGDDFSSDTLRTMTQAVVDGHAQEVFGPGRSTVTLTLTDGTTETDTGVYGLLNMLTPRPGWRTRGRRVIYPPYA